eukprot:1072277-Rhodomonas_salina.2
MFQVRQRKIILLSPGPTSLDFSPSGVQAECQPSSTSARSQCVPQVADPSFQRSDDPTPHPKLPRNQCA